MNALRNFFHRSDVRDFPKKRGGLWGLIVLVLWTFVIYWPILSSEFVSLDDRDYVTENLTVQSGVTPESLKWAFTATTAANWHPLTWISHMLDCAAYGPRPGLHHLTSLILHIFNSCLLFIMLAKLTHKRSRGFVVAALFAWHPMHVESVAWVAERKDVLSTFFFLLTLLAYGKYVFNKQSESEGRLREGRRWRPGKYDRSVRGRILYFGSSPSLFFSAAVFLFALGLMSKPMLVTLPFVLLLLDYWPLARWRGHFAGSKTRSATTLILEKVPFFILSGLSCVTTIYAQRGAVASLQSLPLDIRMENTLRAYLTYVEKLLWPQNMAVFYPFNSASLSTLELIGTSLFMALTLLALTLGKRGWLTVGWLWFAGTLVPVIGIMQVGSQSWADRYTYIPSIGFFVVLVWGLGLGLSYLGRHGKLAGAGLAVLVLFTVGVITTRQVEYWRDSEALYMHALEVTGTNSVAYMNLSDTLNREGRQRAAFRWSKLAAEFRPNDPMTQHNYAVLLGVMHEHKEAIAQFYRTLLLNPDDAENRYQLAALLSHHGSAVEAAKEYERVIKDRPDWILPINNLAWLLATSPDAQARNGTRAVELANRALSSSGSNDAPKLDTLAAALAEAGDFSTAIVTATNALKIARSGSNFPLANEIEEHLNRFETGAPIRTSR